MIREGAFARKTLETDIRAELALDCPAEAGFSGGTGIGFLDHLLGALARHGAMRIALTVTGDLAVDGHHTAEDVGICLGTALRRALDAEGKPAVVRFADAAVPMDEALARVALDVSGRPYLAFSHDPLPPMIGEFDTQLAEEFLRAFCQNAGLTLHCEARGQNGHHMLEALLKALARALRTACALSGDGGVPSTKGVL